MEGQQACRGVRLGDDGSPCFLPSLEEPMGLSKDGERLGALGLGLVIFAFGFLDVFFNAYAVNVIHDWIFR